MLKSFFTNRLIIGALIFLFLFCAGCLLYLQHIEREIARDKARTDKIIERFEQRNKSDSTQAPPSEAAEPETGDEWHAAHTPNSDGDAHPPNSEPAAYFIDTESEQL